MAKSSAVRSNTMSELKGMSGMGRWLVGMVLAALGVVGFASTFVVAGELTRHCGVTPMAIVVTRFAFAGLVLLAWCSSSAERRQCLFVKPTRRDWMMFAIVGPLGTILMAWCEFSACSRVGSANAAMTDVIAPLMIFVLAAWRTRRVAPWQIAGVLCGFAGALLVIGVVNSDGIALSAYGTGDLFVLGAATMWALYTVAARDPVRRLGSVTYTAWTMLSGAVACLPFLPFADPVWPATPRAWGLMAYICVVPTIGAFCAWNAAQKFIQTETLAMTAYFTPVAALAIGCLLFGETATAMQLLGTLVICAAALVEFKGGGRM